MSRPLAAALLVLGLLAAPAGAQDPGAERVKYRFGPIHITPGQNTIEIAPTTLRPDRAGWITRFEPNLEFADGSKPSVDVVHLHHGVWLVNGETRFAVGEEKTIVDLPDGFGFRYGPEQSWLVNYMIHNLTRGRHTVYITYTLDFVPETAPEAAGMKPVRTRWMDVAGPSGYPVFDALRGTGRNDRLTIPDDAPNLPGLGTQHTWTVARPTTLVSTAVHLHPGGLNGYLTVTRGGQTTRIFTSRANYYEPAGAVSWDVSMTATPEDWRVALLPGDVVKLHVVYDTKRASWYESMGIMPISVVEDSTEGVDPFTGTLNQQGVLTHGRLEENRSPRGGQPTGLPNPLRLLDGPVGRSNVTIAGFVYGQGDLALTGRRGRPPVMRPGQRLTFTNRDAQIAENGGIFHTITSCRLPCTGSGAINFPLADGPVTFDSGELGFGRGITAAANRDTWQTPATLRQGTYAYFCRVHPFMRGAFRVKAKRKRSA